MLNTKHILALSLLASSIALSSDNESSNAAIALGRENKALKQTFSMLSGWNYDTTREDEILKSLSKERYFPYQDIVVNGQTLWNGLGTDCPSRYEAMNTMFKEQYNRPFTLLDIGASNGYFSLRAAKDFNAQATMVDMSDRLGNICELNTDVNKNLIYMKKQLSAQDLKSLREKGVHFDVAMMLHVLHHVPAWKEFKNELMAIADTVVIETPPANDLRLDKKTTIPAIEKHLLKLNGKVIAETPRTKPGHFDSLTTMRYGMKINVPLDNEVKSKMFVFVNKDRKNLAFTPLSAEQFADHNVIFPKTK